MSDIAIKFENISKQYRLGVVGTGTVSHDLNRWWHRIRGKEDPYLKIGDINDRAAKANGQYVWALKDINFDIKQGDVVGIIGKNGAGKSTLLKILSRVTSPTTGSIKAKGRIASLLEVGTGFHPELTGRENIFMNGAIMGMTKTEIRNKLDEIVDFAGVEKYIDTPTKRYSSGMTVRLGFAIAAHLEPEILIVDEVLAVGDAEFQKKAVGKMQDVTKGNGRTVLFVSHNMGIINSLCKNSVLLANGMILNTGPTEQIINQYMSTGGSSVDGATEDYSDPHPGQRVKIRSVKILDANKMVSAEISNANKAYVEVGFEVIEEGRGYDVGFHLIHSHLGLIFGSNLKDKNLMDYGSNYHKKGNYKYLIELPVDYLKGGNYAIQAHATIANIEVLDKYQYDTQFQIIDMISPIAITNEARGGSIIPILEWEKL